jgi:hypothetical protein
MELGRQFKQPHQMSPDEFAAHPAAIFHGTYLPDEDVMDVTNRRGYPSSGDNYYENGKPIDVVPKMHLGTFQAALDAVIQNRNSYSDKATIHTYWQTPKVSGATGNLRLSNFFNVDKGPSEEDVNNPENVAHFVPGAHYYENQNEGEIGDPSFATDTPHKYLTSQADYVKAALDRGVPESDIHPRTLKLYKAGTLGKMTMPARVADYMTKYHNKLGPYTNAGPTWDYLNSEEEAPKRSEE